MSLPVASIRHNASATAERGAIFVLKPKLNARFGSYYWLKLKAHGIGDSITDWIEQWLTDRRQRVVVDGEVSNWKSVLSWVPQGSVLGPILFLIYINDLDDNITSNVLKFADDTKLFRKVNTDGDKQHLQNDLDRLVKWSEKWQMLLNFSEM